MAGSLSTALPWELARTKWAATLNALLGNPVVSGLLINDITVVPGANVINHKLGRKIQGYIVTMNSASVTFYDSQSTNQMPDLTLVLNASGNATISLYCF